MDEALECSKMKKNEIISERYQLYMSDRAMFLLQEMQDSLLSYV